MADGYARAGGGVGVAQWPRSGWAGGQVMARAPRTLVTGIATAQMDSVPMVCITGQVPSKLIGYDAFQETDITGITLPITKHSYLVTRRQDIMPAIKEAFHLAKSGRPGPVLVDITKDAQHASSRVGLGCHAGARCAAIVPASAVPKSELGKAADLIRSSKKPVILAGQGFCRAVRWPKSAPLRSGSTRRWR
jgi:acetolactate synthase-1/2/3 large subunit